jgi:PAT family beta-lactamase induction signal transducer AmpG
MKTDNSPWYWIPVLNFASGLPYVSLFRYRSLYKNLGINNEDIGIYTSLLYLPWVIKLYGVRLLICIQLKENGFKHAIAFHLFLIVGLTIPLSNFLISLAVFG